MAEEHGAALLNLTCLRGESRLKSETLRGVIHILSRCYELPKETCRGDDSGPGGDHKNSLHLNEPDPATAINLDAAEDIISTHDSQHGDDQQMHFSMDDIENFLMDIDGIQEPVPVNVSINQKALQLVPGALLEKEAVEQHLPESSQHENGFLNIVEFDEAAQRASGSDKCVPSQKEQINQNQLLDEPNIQSGSTNSQTNVHMTNGCDDIEEGEIDDIHAQEKSSVSRENNVDSLQHSEAGADYQHSVEHKLCVSDFSRSTSVRIVDNCPIQNDSKIERDFQAISDACANFDTVKTVDIPIVNSAETHASLCANDSRKPVFYGDISEEASQNAQGTLQMGVNIFKEKKRGGSSKEKRKLQKRKKRKEIDKKLGVKRMKLPPALMPKAVKVCQHFLKGRCLKGDKCTFSHDATPLTKSEACVHFARNNCLKGDACPYDHQLGKYPCNNYASQGFCNRGNGCLFSHEIPAEEGSQGASTAEKLDLKSPSVPETSSKIHANSAASISIKPPVQVPKGLSFLSLGKSGSDSFSRRKPSSSSQIADMIGLSNHSRHNVPGTAKILKGTSKPILAPVTSNNDSFLDTQLDHSVGNKNSVFKACSKSLIDSTSSLDRGLLGLHSLVSSKVPLNCVNNELLETSAKEHTPPVSHFSRLGMHSGSSMGNEMSVLKVDIHKEQTSISKSQITDNMHVEAIQAEAPTRVHCFSSDKSLEIKPNQTLAASISKDHESGKKVSIQNQRTHGIPRHSCAEELNTIVSTIPSSCSQGLAENKSMLCSVPKALIPALSFASKIECETKVPSLGSVGNSQFKKEPESGISSSRGRGSFNSGPVKASAVLDFIFGTGGKTQK
uniref:C3H1-type domain-containing protein n=2 Tax=Kalanchoe fedtschenkoi TaxID=63787 RepID=A0A7N0TVY1_KALFE